MKNLYCQCSLQKGNTVQQVWIPSEFAKLGKLLKVKDEDTNIWETGWKVSEAGTIKITEDYALMLRDLYRTQREASDI